MNINFGAKIPVSEFQVKNMQSGKFEKARLYEFDCNDLSDIEYFVKQQGNWKYKPLIIRDMALKNHKIKYYNSLSEIEKKLLNTNHYYALETDDKSLLGICESRNYKTSTDIHLLETSSEHKYKYAGQGIIAALSKRLLKENPKHQMTINMPLHETKEFYIKKCGFKQRESYTLSMNSDEIRKSVDNFEKTTQKPIIDLYL